MVLGGDIVWWLFGSHAAWCRSGDLPSEQSAQAAVTSPGRAGTPTAALADTELERLQRQRPKEPSEESTIAVSSVVFANLGLQLLILSGFSSASICHCYCICFSLVITQN